MSRFLLFTLSFFIASAAVAADDVQTLKQFFTGLTTLSADFEQTVLNAQLSVTETSKGTLVIKRPGQFRWNYQTPYEQEIVADGKRVWIFDKDLEQVTVKPFDATLGNTPALLLSSEDALEKGFLMKNITHDNNLTWVQLLPKESEGGFNSIELGFKNGTLAQMHLSDNLGQTTQLSFTNVRRNPPVDEKQFIFSIPDGVDVFDTSH